MDRGQRQGCPWMLSRPPPRPSPWVPDVGSCGVLSLSELRVFVGVVIGVTPTDPKQSPPSSSPHRWPHTPHRSLRSQPECELASCPSLGTGTSPRPATSTVTAEVLLTLSLIVPLCSDLWGQLGGGGFDPNPPPPPPPPPFLTQGPNLLATCYRSPSL